MHSRIAIFFPAILCVTNAPEKGTAWARAQKTPVRMRTIGGKHTRSVVIMEPVRLSGLTHRIKEMMTSVGARWMLITRARKRKKFKRET